MPSSADRRPWVSQWSIINENDLPCRKLRHTMGVKPTTRVANHGEDRTMPASYFNARHVGHSRRGESARDRGARAWSRIPARLRKGFTSAEAEELRISCEWHHAGKYATPVYVYYPSAVDAFWKALDDAGITADDVRAHWDDIRLSRFEANRDLLTAINTARRIAYETAAQFEYDRDCLLD